MGEDISLV